MFRKVLSEQSEINERIFVIQVLRKVDVYDRIPAGERNSFYDREVPLRNIDLVIDACIQTYLYIIAVGAACVHNTKCFIKYNDEKYFHNQALKIFK